MYYYKNQSLTECEFVNRQSFNIMKTIFLQYKYCSNNNKGLAQKCDNAPELINAD